MFNDNSNGAEPGLYRTDEEFRKSRRNLLWVSALAFLTGIARSQNEDHFLFGFGAVGSTINVDRGILSFFLILTISYFWIYFERDLLRIIRTLNSPNAVNLAISGAPDEELASLTIRKRSREIQEATIEATHFLMEKLNEAIDRVPDFFIERNALFTHAAEFKQLLRSDDEAISNLHHWLGRIEALSEDPMGFPLNTPEREEFENCKSLMATWLGMMRAHRDTLASEDLEKRFAYLLQVKESDANSSVKKIEEDLKFSVEKLNKLYDDIDSRIEIFDKFAESFEKSERLFFGFFEKLLPRLSALVSIGICLVWTHAWIEYNLY